MGLLDGDLAASIYAGFKGKLLKGIIRQTATPESGGLDQLGDDIDDPVPVDTPCEGFTEAYSLAYRQRAGIPQGDLKLCIFAASIPRITPGLDDKARLDRKSGSQWYQIREAATDPAGALWECRAFEIKAPPP